MWNKKHLHQVKGRKLEMSCVSSPVHGGQGIKFTRDQEVHCIFFCSFSIYFYLSLLKYFNLKDYWYPLIQTVFVEEAGGRRQVPGDWGIADSQAQSSSTDSKEAAVSCITDHWGCVCVRTCVCARTLSHTHEEWRRWQIHLYWIMYTWCFQRIPKYIFR